MTTARPVAIIGPTGTGKSQLALDFAERVGAEIVNADAMQLYRGMDIGTAKLPVGARRGIPHHQLDVLDVTETATVARYQRAAAADVEAIAGRGAVPVIVGGSMLYVQSLLDDWSFPATDPEVRARWERRLAEVGVGELHAELARRDPAASAASPRSVWASCTPSWPAATRRPFQKCGPFAARSRKIISVAIGFCN
ncbi:tRNA (adenosine(37)-N6)-dimethylallyltransferase, partial [Mycobacterium palustre]|uniref:tRNA (adenosine(37)-N6)-dimethylallyltransferase n=1 Tax=Mycobacterium palustre TaxID=153971 RepID=UPI0023E1D3F4